MAWSEGGRSQSSRVFAATRPFSAPISLQDLPDRLHDGVNCYCSSAQRGESSALASFSLESVIEKRNAHCLIPYTIFAVILTILKDKMQKFMCRL